jgi:cell division transport system ATP-binding protein
MSNLVVDLRNVYVQQAGRPVLQGVNFRISAGEFVYLIGKTGSGKSSLLKTLYGALSPNSGQGLVAGYDLSSLNRNSIPLLRRKLGIVFQDFSLLTDRSVAENLRFVLRATGWTDAGRIEARIAEMLAQVGLSDKGNRMPHELSGGEQQRVAIARALLNNPVLLLADEPTGNLDPETSDDILLLMRRLAQHHHTAVLFATHDYRLLEHFQARIVRCLDGRIVNEEEMRI